MSGAEKNAPNSGTEAGGAGEDRAGHQIIIGDSIAPDDAGTDQKDLLPDTGASVVFMRNFWGWPPRPDLNRPGRGPHHHCDLRCE